MKQKILVIIPFFNEYDALKKLKTEICKNIINYDFLLINDNSTDNSDKLFTKKKILILNNKKRMGIGYSLKKGLKFSLIKKYQVCVFMSGNGKMKISDIEKMTKPIIKNNYDYINGSRFIKYNKKSNTPMFRYFSIKIISNLLSFLFQKNITDFSCGFRAFKCKKFLQFTKIKNSNLYNTYGFEYYLYAKVLKSKLTFKEVSIAMWYPNKKLKKKYSKILPIIDWYKMLIPWTIAYLDGKEMLKN
jgi:dolichol-phosphate mannosyltransferase